MVGQVGMVIHNATLNAAEELKYSLGPVITQHLLMAVKIVKDHRLKLKFVAEIHVQVILATNNQYNVYIFI